MNMIGTGGYGGQTYSSVADIDWSKSISVIEFGSESNEFKFIINSSEFKIASNYYSFNIEKVTKNSIISVNSANITFKIRK